MLHRVHAELVGRVDPDAGPWRRGRVGGLEERPELAVGAVGEEHAQHVEASVAVEVEDARTACCRRGSGRSWSGLTSVVIGWRVHVSGGAPAGTRPGRRTRRPRRPVDVRDAQVQRVPGRVDHLLRPGSGAGRWGVRYTTTMSLWGDGAVDVEPGRRRWRRGRRARGSRRIGSIMNFVQLKSAFCRNQTSCQVGPESVSPVTMSFRPSPSRSRTAMSLP